MFSKELLQGLVDLFFSQSLALSLDVVHQQDDLFCHLSTLKEQCLTAQLESIVSNSPPPLRRAVECCTEKAASSWLSALPLKQYGFALHKGEFIDAICLRYGFIPSRLPSHCVCDKDFTLSHALSCPHCAFPIIRQNEIRANLMSEVCHDVQIEPHLHPLSGEIMHHCSAVLDDDAQVDIRASGFGGVYTTTPSSMSVFLTVLQPPIVLPPLLLLFVSMRLKSATPMRNVCVRWSMAVSPPWYFLHQVAWGRQPLPLRYILPACSARSGVPLILWL